MKHNFNLTVEQKILIAKLVSAERNQFNKINLYNPLVEAICYYQKEIIIKRMVTILRESFYNKANEFMSNYYATQVFAKEASYLRSASCCSIPYVNTLVFPILSQYAVMHGSLKTGFDEVFEGLLFRTRFIRRDKLSLLATKPSYRLALDITSEYTNTNLVPWYPDWYPRVYFIDDTGLKRISVNETEKQILLGLN
jgi:hypothetical protein